MAKKDGGVLHWLRRFISPRVNAKPSLPADGSFNADCASYGSATRSKKLPCWEGNVSDRSIARRHVIKQAAMGTARLMVDPPRVRGANSRRRIGIRSVRG